MHSLESPKYDRKGTIENYKLNNKNSEKRREEWVLCETADPGQHGVMQAGLLSPHSIYHGA
jgi:hypothetical protein